MERMIFKLNEDDILEILSEHLATANGFSTFNARIVIIGTPGDDLRLIAVVSNEDDTKISDLNLIEIDESMNYNGSHSVTHALDVEKFLNMDITDC